MNEPRWLVLTVGVPSEELSLELAEGLLALGGSAVEEGSEGLTTYVREPADLDGFLDEAAERLSAIAGSDPGLRWRWQDDEDWSRRWKEGLEPRRVGRRLVVTQPWNEVEPDRNRIVIVIDPSSAFGTGEHATTRGALRLMEGALEGGERVLDVGTGSGILAIAADRLGAAWVLAVEEDDGALETARENLDRNRAARVALAHGRVDPAYLELNGGGGFDLIAANVLSGILVPLLPAFARATRPGGRLILGGILASEAAGVLAAARAAGFRLLEEDREQEWWTGLFGAPAG